MSLRMPFERRAAVVLGILLPVLEAARRRTDFEDLPAYADDFLIGGLLLLAAWSCARGRRFGPVLLVVAWSILCGGLYYSFFGQLRSEHARDVSGLPNGAVVAIKGALGVIAIVALVRSALAAVRDAGGGTRP